jgi:hypothetical protein
MRSAYDTLSIFLFLCQLNDGYQLHTSGWVSLVKLHQLSHLFSNRHLSTEYTIKMKLFAVLSAVLISSSCCAALEKRQRYVQTPDK